MYYPNKLEGIRLLVMSFTCHRRSFAQTIVIHLLLFMDLLATQYAYRNSPTIADLCQFRLLIVSGRILSGVWRCLAFWFSTSSFCSRCERKFSPVYALRRTRGAEV
jgi:hypothetical protein